MAIAGVHPLRDPRTLPDVRRCDSPVTHFSPRLRCADPKAGAVDSLFDLLRDERLNHQVEVMAGLEGERAGQLLTEFFRRKRQR